MNEIGKPTDYWPISPEELRSRTVFPDAILPAIENVFTTYLFAEKFDKFEKDFKGWEATRELFWKRYRRSSLFRFMTVIQNNKSKREALEKMIDEPRFVAYLLTPTKTASEMAEEKLREVYDMGLLSDEGELNKEVVKILVAASKEREDSLDGAIKGEENPFKDMSPEIVEILKKAVRDE